MKPLAVKFRSKSPFIVTSRGGCGHYKENTIQGLEAALALRPDVIEIDIRRSRDGVLFCHHGSIPFGVLFWYFAPLLPFSWIKKRFSHVPTLVEIVGKIPPNTTIIFDVKDSHIPINELKPYFERFSAVCVMSYSIEYLEVCQKSLPQDYFYILGPVLGFKRKFPRIKAVVDALALFPWQYQPEIIKEIEDAGILHDPLFALLFPGQLKRITKKFHILSLIELKDVPHTHAL